MIDFLVGIFWVGLVVISVTISVTITLRHLEKRAAAKQAEQNKEGHL